MPKQFIKGFKGDECQCGRRESIRHCTVCGSTRLYAYAKLDWKEHADGTFTKEQFYRCIGCGHKFTDKDREFCAAPPIDKALAMQRIKVLKGGKAADGEDTKLVDALVTLLTPAAQSDHKKAHDLLVYNLRVEFADKRAAGDATDETMEQYVERRLKELGAPDRSASLGTVVGEKTQSTSTDRALASKGPDDVETTVPSDLVANKLAEDPSASDVITALDDDRTIPIEERSIRLQWARKKLAGQRVPPIDEYVRRCLAGEVFGEEEL